MSAPPSPQQAWRNLEHIVAEFRPEIRPINARALAHLCQDIATSHPGHIHDRIGTYLAISGLITTLVGPKSIL